MILALACFSALRIPGNVGFDPLQLQKVNPFQVKDSLFTYREAELKHGRLAMLAAVAYPLQEKLNPLLSEKFNLPNLLANGDLSPSLLNGNLTASVLIFFIGIGIGLELYNMKIVSDFPADSGWRFTKFKEESEGFFRLQEGEVWNSRLAMVAVLGYIVQEGLTKMPVV